MVGVQPDQQFEDQRAGAVNIFFCCNITVKLVGPLYADIPIASMPKWRVLHRTPLGLPSAQLVSH